MANWWDRLGLHAGFSLCILAGCSAQGVVEGFDGGAVVLPCTVSIQGALRWTTPAISILIRFANGSALPPENSPWKDVVSFVGSSNNLSISPLSHQRDDNRAFWCEGVQGRRGQNTTVRVLAKITGAGIEQASGGRVTVTEGTSKTLTCALTGNPNPPPSYSWSVDNGGVLGQRSSYTLTANRSMRNITCTAINTYSNGSVLNTAEATATLIVLYLDTPSAVTHVTVTENEAATLPCSAQGNPLPTTFEWRRSGSAEVMSTSADYRIENVQRSAAGEYTCDVTNRVRSRQTRVKLVVQYPPAVTVTYDKSTHTLTCTAEGDPDTYTFSPWEQRLGGTLIRTLGIQRNTDPGTLQLNDTMTYADTGDYVCSVTNGVKSPQKGLVHVAPPTPAVFQKHSESVTIGLEKTQTISVHFYVRPSSGKVQVRWEKAGETNALQSHQEEPGLVNLTVYGQQVSLEGTVTTLTLTDVRQADEGNYSVTVTSDISGGPRVSQTSFHVSVTEISVKHRSSVSVRSPPPRPAPITRLLLPSTFDIHPPLPVRSAPVSERGASVHTYHECFASLGGAESNTGAIVGGVLGSLVGILVICAGVVIVLKRHKTKGSPEIVENRHMASIGENNEGVRHFLTDADNIPDPNVSQAQNYETLNQFHAVGSSDRTYDQLHVPVIGTNNTYENTQVPGTSTRTTTSRDNYETLDQTHAHAEGSPVHTYDQLQIAMRGKSETYENTEVACRITTNANALSYENVNI